MTTILFDSSPVPIEVTYDPTAANVAMTVYEFSGSAWTQVGSAVAALLVDGYSTWGSIFTPPNTNPHVVIIQPFTDNTFTTPDPNYSPSSRSFVIDSSLAALTSLPGVVLASQSVGNNIEAVVLDNSVITGVVLDLTDLT
jgi:hypothetical protein